MKCHFSYRGKLGITLLAVALSLAGCFPKKTIRIDKLSYVPDPGTATLIRFLDRPVKILVGPVTDGRGLGRNLLTEPKGWQKIHVGEPLVITLRRALISELQRSGIDTVSSISEADASLEAEIMRIHHEFKSGILGDPNENKVTFSFEARLLASQRSIRLWEDVLTGFGSYRRYFPIDPSERIRYAASQALSDAVGKVSRSPGFTAAVTRLAVSGQQVQ